MESNEGYKNKEQWQDRRYIPKSGGIIFFDWEMMEH